MVGGLARDDLGAHRVAVELVELARELPGGLDGLRAAGGEEDAVEVAGREAGDALGQLDGGRVGVAPVGVEGELLGLARARLADLRAAVAGVDAEERREAVQVALVVLVVDVRALAAHDDGDLVLAVVPAHSREMHPQVAASLLLKLAGRARALFGYVLGGSRHSALLGLDAADNGIVVTAGRLGGLRRNNGATRCAIWSMRDGWFRRFATCGDAVSAIACP